MRRRIAIALVAAAAVVGLFYAAIALDLVGMLISMHAPPAGTH